MNNRKIYLTLILPLKNEEKDTLIYLYNALATQKCKSFKVLVVDESDKHHFQEVITFVVALRSAGIYVDVVHNDLPYGVGLATLQGLLLSDTPFVFFLDADNIPRQEFVCRIEETILGQDIDNIAFISFLSTYRFRPSLSNRTLLNARLYLSTFLKGLHYRRGTGFVNILRVWNKDFLLKYVGKDIAYPKLSYQDQPHFWKNVAEGLRKGFRTIHIEEVLIEDIRHLVEDFNVRFICRRITWYTSALTSRRNRHNKLPNKALVSVTVLASILLFMFLRPHAMAYILLIFLLAYVGTFLTLCVLRGIPLLNTNTLLAMSFIPLLLLIETTCIVKTLLGIVKRSLLRKLHRLWMKS